MGASSKRRVLRGGSFINNRQDVRSAYRNRNNPDNRNRNIGFRVVAPTGFGAGIVGWGLSADSPRPR